MKLHSSFWLGDMFSKRLDKRHNLSPLELAEYQQSIAKFVRILTKENIPVQFQTAGNSCTDGETVYISSDISSDNFDSIVGLSLHEGSHIVLTNFDFLPNFSSQMRKVLKTNRFDLSYSEINDWLDILEANIWTFKSILNYVEDRRIDYYVYTNSPGYKPYYQSMYDRYFNAKEIDEALVSDEFTDKTLESYMFRIINLINENRRLDVLPGLEEIYNMIRDEIPKMKNTNDAAGIAFKVFRIVWENIEQQQQEQEQQGNDGESGDESDEQQEGQGQGSDEQGESEESSNSDSKDSNESDDGNGQGMGEADDSEESDDSGEPSNDSEEGQSSNENSQSSQSSSQSQSKPQRKLTDSEKEKVREAVEKQRKFLEGRIHKETITDDTQQQVDALCDLDYDNVETSYDSRYDGEKVNVMVIRGFNEGAFNIFHTLKRNKKEVDGNPNHPMIEVVNDGFKLGKRLGKKLQIRNRERTTTYNRQKKGKLDKRRIHALGSGSYNVFNQYRTEKHRDAFLHLSIDGSGSMNGTRFEKAILSAVAIAQMADMTNIDVQISIRYTGGLNDSPILWIVYDSRKEKLRTIKKYFKYLRVMGTTPEGLCFESIMDELPIGSDVLKTYFINYSDGEPYYRNYSGDAAIQHTRKQVDKIKSLGYKVLSFFVAGSNCHSSDFKDMYGSSASFINPTQLNDLVKTLQKMFLQK